MEGTGGRYGEGRLEVESSEEEVGGRVGEGSLAVVSLGEGEGRDGVGGYRGGVRGKGRRKLLVLGGRVVDRM